MQKRRVITSAVVVATVGAITALTLPAIAGTENARPDRDPSDAVQVSAEMFAALQRDLRLTRPQAQARLARDAWATRTTNTLRKSVGDAWAGAWLSDDATQLNVAVTDASQVERIRRAGAQARVVTRSAVTLDGVKRALDQQAAKADASIPGWYVDPASNSVVVLSRSGRAASVRAFVAAAGVPADTIRVAQSDEKPRLLNRPNNPQPSAREGERDSAEQNTGANEAEENAGQQGAGQQGAGQQGAGQQGAGQQGAGQPLVGGSAYFINGQARCSVGFAVQGGFVSAGHCGQQGDETSALAGGQEAAQGTFAASSFPGDDFSAVAVEDTFVPTGEVDTFNGQTQPNGGGQDGLPASGENVAVAGSEEAPVGSAVCKFGSTSGASCGVIEARNASVQVADPTDGVGQVTVSGMIRTDVCAEGGDSGGSLLAAGNQAQGVVSSGSGDCQQGGVTFFQPVNEILDRLNLTLITSN